MVFKGGRVVLGGIGGRGRSGTMRLDFCALCDPSWRPPGPSSIEGLTDETNMLTVCGNLPRQNP